LLSANIVEVGLMFVAAIFWALNAVLTQPFRTNINLKKI
jgi:uncharacterized membrane protein YwzB